MPSNAPYIVTLDVGTSSVRTLLFDGAGRQQDGFGEHLTYQIATTHDGGVEVDPQMLLDLCVRCLAKLHQQLQAAQIKPAAVGFDTFWHSFLGIDANQDPTTPIVHLFDTRSTAEVKQLEGKLDAAAVHARTGCRLHTSYWPSKLLWLSKYRTAEFKATARWISFGEYLFLRILGDPIASTSMASGSGLWNQQANDYDTDMLAALPIERAELCPPDEMDRPASKLTGTYRAQWPLLDGIPWYPALGDGACNNIGSGCTTVHEFSLMVGTSGAMRAVVEADTISIPDGLWCYRVDRKRFILGGALSNGGDVYAWMRRTLALPSTAEAEAALLKSKPGSHGLLLLPFFAGERSPYWRADLRAAITGMDFATTPMDILQAALESVSLRFLEIFTMMSDCLGVPGSVIASGGALLASAAWSQMMADALGMSICRCLEQEATSRGAALLTLERLGAIPSVKVAYAKTGEMHNPVPANTAAYQQLMEAQRKLFNKLFL